MLHRPHHPSGHEIPVVRNDHDVYSLRDLVGSVIGTYAIATPQLVYAHLVQLRQLKQLIQTNIVFKLKIRYF